MTNLAKNLLKLMLLIVLISGCRGTETKDDGSNSSSSGDASKDSEKEGEVDDSTGFSITVQEDKNYSYKIHKGTGASTDDWEAPCRIDSVETPVDMTCIIEANELDLWYWGVGLRVNVPTTMCSYMYQFAPYFYQYAPGDGPTTYVDNSAGTTTNDTVLAGQTSNWCASDYPRVDPKAPNCCRGKYIKKVYTDDPDSVTDKVTTSEVDWGGKWGNCLNGPALDVHKKTESGYPVPWIYFTENSGKNIGYFVKPGECTRGKCLSSNVFGANYFVPADHVQGVPLSTKPMPQGPINFPSTNPTHLFVCTNRTDETLATIRVMVREWNLIEEIVKGVLGTPDTVGTEPAYGTPNNDFKDFKDFAEAYPGAGL